MGTASGSRMGKDMSEKIRKIIRRNLAWAAGAAAGLAVLAGTAGMSQEERRLQQEIASCVVRFHVKADSDRRQDQENKIAVRDALLERIEDLLRQDASAGDTAPQTTDAPAAKIGCAAATQTTDSTDCMSDNPGADPAAYIRGFADGLKGAENGENGREKTENLLRAHLTELEVCAEETLRDRDCAQPVNVTLEEAWFPQKTYGAYTFPAGNYEALNVTIGDGQGHNWWCMLYPSLCFPDALHPVPDEEGEQELEDVLSDEAYDFILNHGKLRFSFFLAFFGHSG